MEIYNFSDFDFLGSNENEPPPLDTLPQPPSNPNNIFSFSQQNTTTNTQLTDSIIITASTSTTLQPTAPAQSSSRVKTKFTKLEDEIIIRFVQEKGAHSWNRIVPLLPGRTPRLVRERWVNYLSPDVNLSPFTKEEDELLIELVKNNGKHWKYISQSFNKRTDIALKNRYMLLMRREKSTLLKQQKAQQQQLQQQQLNQQINTNPIHTSPPQMSSATNQISSINYPSPCLQQNADENCNIDLNVDTESFPTLDDAVECCSEWDFGSYQCDDLPLMCDYQFQF